MVRCFIFGLTKAMMLMIMVRKRRRRGRKKENDMCKSDDHHGVEASDPTTLLKNGNTLW